MLASVSSRRQILGKALPAPRRVAPAPANANHVLSMTEQASGTTEEQASSTLRRRRLPRESLPPLRGNKVMRWSTMLVALCLVSTAAFARASSPEELADQLKNPWVVEFITSDGKFSRILGYPTLEACEAAIPAVCNSKEDSAGTVSNGIPRPLHLKGRRTLSGLIRNSRP